MKKFDFETKSSKNSKLQLIKPVTSKIPDYCTNKTKTGFKLYTTTSLPSSPAANGNYASSAWKNGRDLCPMIIFSHFEAVFSSE